MENKYITADQLNTVFKRDGGKKTSTVLRTLTQTMYTKPSFHLETSLNPAALLAHTHNISHLLFTGLHNGVNLATHVPADVSLRCRLIYLGRCFLRLNGRSSAQPSPEEQRYHRLNRTTGVLVRLHLSRCSLKRDGSRLWFEFLWWEVWAVIDRGASGFSTELFCHLTLPCWYRSITWGGYIEFKTIRTRNANFYGTFNGGRRASFNSTVPYKLKRTLILLYCLHSCFCLCRLLCHCALCALSLSQLFLSFFCHPFSTRSPSFAHPLHRHLFHLHFYLPGSALLF